MYQLYDGHGISWTDPPFCHRNHYILRSNYTERQHQRCDDACGTGLIESNIN